MTVALSTWVNRVAPDVPGCPAPLIEREILETAREFCRDARVWSEQLAAIKILTGVDRYALTSSNGRILGVKRARIDDTGADLVVDLDEDGYLWLDYKPAEDSDLHLSLTDLTFNSAAGTIASAATDFAAAGVEAGDEICVTGTSYNNRTFTVESVATTTITVDADEDTVTDEGSGDASATICIGGLVVWVYLQPEKTATALPDILWHDYEDAISSGARWRLLRLPGRAWSNPELAGYYQREFELGKSRGLGITRHGRGTREARIRVNRRFVV